MRVKSILAGVYAYPHKLEYLIYDLQGNGTRESLSRAEFQKRIDRLNKSKRVIEIRTIIPDDSSHSSLAMINEYIIRVP